MLLQEKRDAASLRTTINYDWKYDIFAHSSRLVRPAQAIARQLGLTRESVRRVGLAALLHDLGKLALPGAILEKPGPLSADEWDVIRSHPDIGCSILQRLGGQWENIALIVATHHERWDGRGYPRGLAREEIPLEARILAVVDAYDAMISPRAYQSPLSIEEARGELERCSGQQFDPHVVEAFLLLVEKQSWTRLVPSQQQVQPEREQDPADLDGSHSPYSRISHNRRQQRLTHQGA